MVASTGARSNRARPDPKGLPAATCTMPDVHARMLGALDPSLRSLTIRVHILGEIPDAGH
jgi:hypothetical protein